MRVWDDMITYVFALGAIAVLVICVLEAYRNISADDDCQSACGIVRHELIDDVCHCATDDGYARPERTKAPTADNL